ncbi:serine hydrolase [Streptomyces sp. CRN 30]|uniref:serine hydrolase n=1 Tax=Streptomyces sp. CRN 30 TaxID=3075613 RepID=UPI002A824808|nr:serine hydrolase [Streptomyces sp. CRN 30]
MNRTHRTHRRLGHVRAAVAGAVGAGLLIPSVAVAAPATGPPAGGDVPKLHCTSDRAALAAALYRDITAALAHRRGTIAVGVHDRGTDTTCTLRADTTFDSASVVKVTVLATLLRDARQEGRRLTQRERQLSTAMITKSDNAATSTLWRQLGMAKIKDFLAAAGMTETRAGANGYWGLTQITVRDEQKLLALITAENSVLSDANRAYILELMGKVVPSQRWGTPAGAPATVSVHVKNGWLSRSTYGWRVHSIGAFEGAGHDYTIVVLTHGNSTMNYGVATIQGIARAVHADLVPVTHGAGAQRYEPTDEPEEAFVPVPPTG